MPISSLLKHHLHIHISSWFPQLYFISPVEVMASLVLLLGHLVLSLNPNFPYMHQSQKSVLRIRPPISHPFHFRKLLLIFLAFITIIQRLVLLKWNTAIEHLSQFTLGIFAFLAHPFPDVPSTHRENPISGS